MSNQILVVDKTVNDEASDIEIQVHEGHIFICQGDDMVMVYNESVPKLINTLKKLHLKPLEDDK